VCLSGRGDKDMDYAARYFHLYVDGAGVREAPPAMGAAKGEGTKL
jgi:tryptophan synthase beta chain